MIKLTFLFAANLLVSAAPILAQAPAAAKSAATAKPTASAKPTPTATVEPTATPTPAPAPATLAADDPDSLRPHVNETVDVRGTPTGTGHSKTGTVTYLNFGKAHAAVSAVAFLNAHASDDPAAHKVQSEDDLKPFVGKTIILHGKLADYKGDLQIVLESLDQIKLVP